MRVIDRHAIDGACLSGQEKRYSPPECIGTERRAITGAPDLRYVSTSYVERQNLTMRMGSRRFTRLTNAFSKKAMNLAYAVALHFMHYNFARVHSSLRVTPAMAAGVSDRVWELSEIIPCWKRPRRRRARCRPAGTTAAPKARNQSDPLP